VVNAKTELIFPPHIIPELKGLRQAAWDKLIERAARADETAPEKLAFVLMMARLNNCISCNADSFRALHGCAQCARQTITRFHGSDKELIALHKNALDDVEKFQQK
jgi:hypothetical protein